MTSPARSSQHAADAALRRELAGQMRLAPKRWMRWLLGASGLLLATLGVLGLALPGLPGTPLLLLAAACFAQSSERFFFWLHCNRWFGAYVRYWRTHRGIPRFIKVRVIALLVVSMGVTVFFTPYWPVQLLLAGIAAGVSLYIIMQPEPKLPHPAPSKEQA